MLPTIHIGPFVLPTAALVYLIGAWLALWAVDRGARRAGLNPDSVYALAITGLLAGVVGARLTFVLLHWSAFQENLLGIIWPLNTGYSAPGGLLIGATAAFFYGRARRLELWPTLDALAPGLLVALMAVSLADFLSGAGYGEVTRLPWGVSQYGVRRHPVQLYELLVGAAALVVWCWASAPDRRGFPGRPFLLATAVYGAGRLFVDAYRGNAWLVGGGLHGVQLVALGVTLLSLVLLARRSLRAEPIS